MATSIPVTITREEALEIAAITETVETAGAGEDDKDDEYLKTNLAQVLCI